MVAIVFAAAVAVLAAAAAPAAVTAALAAGVVVLEGVQQVFQFHSNWLTYRATAEALRQNAFLYVARAATYSAEGRRERLAEVVRDVTTKENISWAGTMRQVAQPPTEPS